MTDSAPPRRRREAARVFGVFLRLGLTSFGGPVAHIAIFHDEFVKRRAWLEEAVYADLVALCQFLPGPASSQVGLAIGHLRAGHAGAAMAWLGFTAPSAIAMILLAYGFAAAGIGGETAWLPALKLVAAAVIAQAIWTMGRGLWSDRRRASIGMVATVVLLLAPALQLAVIAAGAAAGRWWLTVPSSPGPSPPPLAPTGRTAGGVLIGAFLFLLAVLPLGAAVFASPGLEVVDAFYRAGSLVFGGGHVVLPLLQSEVVAPGWVENDVFLAGYGAAQALPGPLFTIAAFLGANIPGLPGGGGGGALLALAAIFAPSFLLVPGILPFWGRLRGRRGVRTALAGVNAAVVGLLVAALFDPVFTGSVRDSGDLAFVLGALVLLVHLRWPPWLVVGLAALAAEAAHRTFGILLGT